MIGFDIGGTKCAVCIGEEKDGTIEITKKVSFPTRSLNGPYEVIDRLCEEAEKLTDDFRYIGISCGGPLDSKRGIIMSPPNLPGWDNIEICDIVSKKLGGKVRVVNDADACALAEWRFGAGIGTDNMIFLTFGTGLGSGLILNGKLYSGTNGNAGEIGHIRLEKEGPVGFGKHGSFEGFCSGGGIARSAAIYARGALEKGIKCSFCDSFDELDKINAKTVADCADAGFADAIEIYRHCGEMLGRGLAIVVDVLNPQRIVIGSIFRRSENLLREAMEKSLKEEALACSLECCTIVPAKLGEQIGDYAAISVAASLKEN